MSLLRVHGITLNSPVSIFINSTVTTPSFNALYKSNYDKLGKFFFERYISAHSIMIAFEGVPAIYFNSMFGASNDEAKFVITGNNRDVNRYKWNFKNISNKLNNKDSKENYFYKKISNLLSIKKKQKAFHPNANRENNNLGPKILSFKRESIDKKQTIICITNLSSKTQYFKFCLLYTSPSPRDRTRSRMPSSA